MVSLNLPDANSKFYFDLRGFLLGPVSKAGLAKWENIPMESRWNYWDWGRSIYKESSVIHTKIQGNITFTPAASDVNPAPTDLLPDRVSWSTKQSSPTIRYPKFGLVQAGDVVHEKTASQSINRAVTSVSDTSISFVEATCSLSNGFKVTSIKEYSFSWVRLAGTYSYHSNHSFNIKRWDFPDTYSVGVAVGEDFTQRASFLAVLSCRIGRVTLGYDSSEIVPCYQTLTSPSASPAGMTSWTDMLVARKLGPDEYPIKPMHNGDLAMEASKKVNANSVNMFAFLRDLRDPKTMIPKLRNLSKLKTHADNYLSVKYGILPTISDLKEIVGAMERVKPYLDKNGFKTYSADHRDSMTKNDVEFELEQHIKLAIDDEDDQFQRLAAGLGNIGFDLTTENVWDLIPYSFVVDWFIGVGDFLERVDARQRLTRLNVRYATWSRKETSRIRVKPSSSTPYFGTVERVHYTRWTSDQCPVPPLSLNTTFQDFNHWLESGALIAQRSKR